MKEKNRETKILPSQTMAFDAETGVVDAYVSIMGIRDDDDPPDLIENGAFLKTIAERGPGGAKRIRILWQHDWTEVIGMPVALAEHGRELLPERILAKFPEATGGLYAKTQFVMDVQRGREAHALYRAGAMDEWSIGFDTITSTWEKQDERSYRRLKELRLWEYSPVTWGMNPATVTTNVKNSEPGADAVDLKRLAQLLGVDADLSYEALLTEIEKRLRGEAHNAAEPSARTLTAKEVALLKVKLAEIESQI